MVLFPIALVWVIVVVVWVIRNERKPYEDGEPRTWTRRRPRPPRNPRRGRPDESGGRRGAAGSSRDATRNPS